MTAPARGPASALPEHLPALDVLRGLAIGLILVHHTWVFTGSETWPSLASRAWTALAASAWIGVDLFFVLSGFLITRILLRTRAAPGYFRNFYARRALRIFPLYFIFLAARFLLLPAIAPASDFAGTAGQVWVWTYLTNVLVAARGGFAALPDDLHHFWSLAVEEQFYLAWPLVVLLAGGRRLVAVCAAVAAGAIAFRAACALSGHAAAGYVLTLARADGLALGAAAAVAVHDGLVSRERLERWARPSGLAAAAVLLAFGAARGGLRWTDPLVLALGVALVALASASVLVRALRPRRWAPSAAGRVLASFGKYSYAIYVFQQPIAVFLGRKVRHLLGPATSPGEHLARQAVFLAAFTAISYGVAALSWHALEKRVLRLKGLFEHRPAQAAPADAAPSAASCARVEAG